MESVIRIMKSFLLFTILIVLVSCGGSSGGNNGSNDNGNNGGGNNTGSEFGAVRGTITSSRGQPLNAVHVRAVNISNSNIQIGTFSGITSDLRIQDGFFEIDDLPAGQYKILIEKMDSRLRAYNPTRYSDFLIAENPSISFPDEYYNGSNESSHDDPLEFVAVNVTAGHISGGINFITNDQ